MLRLVVLLLVLLNGTYYAWSQGLLRPYGFAPQQQSEPFRLAQQIHPELVRILPADDARRVEAAAKVATPASGCLQAGLFDERQAEALRQAAQTALPPGSWLLDAAVEPARWIVYMGPYPDAQALAKKRSELSSLNLHFEPLTNPALGFGLSLGGFDTEARAKESLTALNRQGVHTAHVVQERLESRGTVFRVPVVNDALRSRLDGLMPALAGKPLRACQ